MAGAPPKVLWQETFENTQQQLLQATSIPLKEQSLEQFQEYLEALVVSYANNPITKFIRAIEPSLAHVKSFTNALNTLTQGQLGVFLTWGTLQIVIECVCRHSNEVESCLDLIVKINNALPLYKRSMNLYPWTTSLHYPIRAIFIDYMDCCILMIKKFSPKSHGSKWDLRGLKNLGKTLFLSHFQRTIDQKIKSIKAHDDDFVKEVSQIEREASTARDIHHSERLGKLVEHFGISGTGVTETSQQPTYPVYGGIHGWPNKAFVGRETELVDMYQYFNPDVIENAPGPRCCVLHGLGGQGKTQTALAYYWKYREEYKAVFWISSSTVTEVERSYVQAARKLCQANVLSLDFQDASPELNIEQTREWFEGTNENWLLIFDNLEDASLIEKYVPYNLRCGSVIITTQKVHLSTATQDFKKIDLQPLDPAIGSSVLYKIWERTPQNEEEEAISEELCRWVGGLPLAIVTVSGYLKSSGSSVEEIFASLKKSSKVWGSTGVESISNYDKTLSTVFDLALSELSHNALHLLRLLAYFSPQGIPEDLFTQKHQLKSLEFLNNEDEYLEVRRDLGQRQLIKRVTEPGNNRLEIHRSLQMNILHGLTKELTPGQDSATGKKEPILGRRLEIFNEATMILRSSLPNASRLQQNEVALWPIFDRYVPQLLSLQRNSQWPDPPLSPDFEFAKMLSNVGTFLWHTGQIRDCDAIMSQGATILESQPEAFKQTRDFKSVLSDIYLVTGILADCIGVSRRRSSLDHRVQLLKLREEELRAIPPGKITVNDEIRWGNAKGDLACAYMQRGRYVEAKEIMEMLLGYYKKWGSEDKYPFEYSKYYHHMGFILMTEGRSNQALEFAKKGLKLEEDHAGGVDSTVLITKYDVASLYFNAGDLEESLNLHKEVLKARIKLCGKSSQFTSESYEAVGILLYMRGEYKDAAENFDGCLNRYNRSYWTSEGIARARYWYSKVLLSLGKDEEAANERETALRMRDDILEKHSEFLQEDAENEAAIFDQMLPMWIMQLSGKLYEGGRNTAREHQRDSSGVDSEDGKS